MKTKLKKNKLCNLIFPILCKGIIAGYHYDNIIKEDLDTLPKDFNISLGIFPYGNYITLMRKNGIFYTTRKNTPSDLTVTFKNTSAAIDTMLAKQNIAQSFAKHQLLLAGDIAQGLTLVRVINRVECYLFPRFMTKAILPKIKKQVCSIKMYCRIFFKSTKYKTR